MIHFKIKFKIKLFDNYNDESNKNNKQASKPQNGTKFPNKKIICKYGRTAFKNWFFFFYTYYLFLRAFVF